MAKKVNIGATIALDGEKEYRKAVSNINSDMKVLNSEMKLSQEKYKDQADSVEALTAKDKILSEQIEKQKEKIAALRAALENASAQYGENDTKTKNWKISLNEAETKLISLDDELKKNKERLDTAKNGTIDTKEAVEKFEESTKQAKESTSMFGDVLKANLASEIIIDGVKKTAEAVKSIGSSAVDAVKESAAYADTILTMANNTGIATDTLQELNYMQELTDVSLDTLVGSMEKNINSMKKASEGSEKYADAYNKLGVEVTDANDNLLDSETVFWKCIDALKEMENDTERDATAMQLFGRSAQDLNSVIKIGSDGVKDFAKEAREVGAVLDYETLSSLGATDDAFQRLDQTTEIVKRNFGNALAPSIERATKKIDSALQNLDNSIYDVAENTVDFIADGLTWVIENGDTLIDIAAGLGAAIATQQVVSTVSSMLDSYKYAAEGATTAQKLLNIAQSASPVGLLAIGVGAAVTSFLLLKDAIPEPTGEIEKLNEEMDELKKSSEETKENWKQLSQEVDNNLQNAEVKAGKYEILSDKLYDMAKKEKLSNDEKKQMAAIIDELNEAFPELGLELDDVTGKLNLEKDAVDKCIDSYKRQLLMAAAQEDLTKITEEQYNTQKKLAEAIEAQKKAHQELNDYIEENKQKYDELNGSMDSEAGAWIIGYNMQLDNLKLAAEKSDQAVQNLNDAIAYGDSEFEKVMQYISDTSDTLEDLETTTVSFKDKVYTVTTDIEDDMNEIIAVYDEQYKAAYDSITGQIGLFDEFNNKSDITKEEMLSSLKEQIVGMQEWADNLQTLAKRGVDEGLLKELSNMGPKSAGYLNELVSMTDSEIAELNLLWQQKYEAADIMANASAELYTNASSKLDELYEKNQQTINDINSQWNKGFSGFVQAGANIAEGLMSGMQSKSSALMTAVNSMGVNVVGNFKNTLGIHSPSKVFEELGGYTAEGFGIGFGNEIDKINTDISNSINTDFSLKTGDNTSSFANIGNVIAESISKLNLRISVDGDDFGRLVSDSFNKEVRYALV